MPYMQITRFEITSVAVAALATCYAALLADSYLAGGTCQSEEMLAAVQREACAKRRNGNRTEPHRLRSGLVDFSGS